MMKIVKKEKQKSLVNKEQQVIPAFSFFLKYLTERKDKKLRNTIKMARYSPKI